MPALLRRTPLRVKLVALVLALVAAALAVIGVASALALRSYLIARVDGQLATTAQQIAVLRRPPLTGELPSEFLFGLQDDERTQVVFYKPYAEDDLPPMPANLAASTALAGRPYTATARDGQPRWRMLVTRLPDGRVLIVGQSLADVDTAVARLAWINLSVGLAVLVLVAATGAAVVRRSLRPLQEIEETAAGIASGDLTRRVPDAEPGDGDGRTELGRLSRALNAMLTQIETAFTAQAASETAARAAESVARDAAADALASEARARRSEERMRQFVADASHELRTPLTTIRGFAELYRQGAAREPEEIARLLRRIEDEAERMGLLVEDLLLLARLDRERPLTLAPVELPVIAADAVQAARAVAPGRPVTLDLAAGAGPLVVLGDDARLRQVVNNLVSNALTHTPEGTPVTVRLSRAEPAQAVLEVADEGPGLAPEHADRVFERFYRVDAARTRRADGLPSTGLGLAIVAALVAAHEGTVEVDTRPGLGATFRVRLPLAPGVTAAQPGPRGGADADAGAAEGGAATPGEGAGGAVAAGGAATGADSQPTFSVSSGAPQRRRES